MSDEKSPAPAPQAHFITANAGRVQHFGEGVNLDSQAQPGEGKG